VISSTSRARSVESNITADVDVAFFRDRKSFFYRSDQWSTKRHLNLRRPRQTLINTHILEKVRGSSRFHRGACRLQKRINALPLFSCVDSVVRWLSSVESSKLITLNELLEII
jgi:hypothetical protein